MWGKPSGIHLESARVCCFAWRRGAGCCAQHLLLPSILTRSVGRQDRHEGESLWERAASQLHETVLGTREL